MALTDITLGDFEYFKSYATKMINCHEKEFLRQIEPELVRAFYRGRNKHESEDYMNDLRYNNIYRREHYLAYSRIFQASNTILPNLYYQNPKILATPLRNTDPNASILMQTVLNHYMKELKQKEENQEAIMNAWFFGIGWKKIGYQTTFAPRTQDPETTPKPGLMDKVNGAIGSILGIPPDNLQTKDRPDIVDYEAPFNNSESPMNIMLDHKGTLRSGKAKLHRMKRTLYELQNYSGGYDENELTVIEEKLSKKSSNRFDARDCDVNLNELHIEQRNGMWILTWIDEHNKPLKYERSETPFDAFEPIVFTNEPGIRYPISHMKIATQVQEHLDYLSTLFIRVIDKMRNQLLVNEKDLAPGSKQALERNKTGGIIFTNKPITPGTFAQLTSQAVQNDIPMLMNMLQQNATEILGTDEQTVSGQSRNKTLGQDKIANVGTQIRESGMLDKVRDWVIRQKRKEGELIKLYSNAELHLQITGKDFKDPMTGQPIEDKWVSFMTPENPLGLKHYLQGEFDYDINIYEALKPDQENLRAQYMEMISIGSNPVSQDALLQDGKKLKMGLLFEKTLGTFDNIGDIDDYLETLDSRQVAAIQASQVLKQNPSMMMPKPQPSQTEPAQVSNESS